MTPTPHPARGEGQYGQDDPAAGGDFVETLEAFVPFRRDHARHDRARRLPREDPAKPSPPLCTTSRVQTYTEARAGFAINADFRVDHAHNDGRTSRAAGASTCG
jgi:hypothetical protein